MAYRKQRKGKRAYRRAAPARRFSRPRSRAGSYGRRSNGPSTIRLEIVNQAPAAAASDPFSVQTRPRKSPF